MFNLSRKMTFNHKVLLAAATMVFMTTALTDTQAVEPLTGPKHTITVPNNLHLLRNHLKIDGGSGFSGGGISAGGGSGQGVVPAASGGAQDALSRLEHEYKREKAKLEAQMEGLDKWYDRTRASLEASLEEEQNSEPPVSGNTRRNTNQGVNVNQNPQPSQRLGGRHTTENPAATSNRRRSHGGGVSQSAPRPSPKQQRPAMKNPSDQHVQPVNPSHVGQAYDPNQPEPENSSEPSARGGSALGASVILNRPIGGMGSFGPGPSGSLCVGCNRVGNGQWPLPGGQVPNENWPMPGEGSTR